MLQLRRQVWTGLGVRRTFPAPTRTTHPPGRTSAAFSAGSVSQHAPVRNNGVNIDDIDIDISFKGYQRAIIVIGFGNLIPSLGVCLFVARLKPFLRLATDEPTWPSWLLRAQTTVTSAQVPFPIQRL